MKKVITFLIVILAAIIGLYLLWSALGRTAVSAEPDPYIDDVSSYGSDTGSGNLVAVQTYIEPGDYASSEAFQAKMDGYMAEAQAQGWLQPDTIVVFPEWIGTWLVLSNEKQELYEADTLEAAMQLMVVSNLPSFLEAYAGAQGEDKIRDALFRMKADDMAAIYTDTFSALAEKYGVTIVAGSLILPDPTVGNDQLIPGVGALQNVSEVFRRDGTLDSHLTRKVFPTGDEGTFVGGAALDQLAAYDTTEGKLAVLVCADSWYPDSYAALAGEAPQIFVVPNNLNHRSLSRCTRCGGQLLASGKEWRVRARNMTHPRFR